MNQKISRVDVEPAKPRKWTEEETKLLIELAQRKETYLRWRESLDVTSPQLDDEPSNWVCFCRKDEVRGSFSFFSRHRDAAGSILCRWRRADTRCCLVTASAEMKQLTGRLAKFGGQSRNDPL